MHNEVSFKGGQSPQCFAEDVDDESSYTYETVSNMSQENQSANKAQDSPLNHTPSKN